MIEINKANSEDIGIIAKVCRRTSSLYDPIIPGSFEKQATRYEEQGLPSQYEISIIRSDGMGIGFLGEKQLNDKVFYLVAIYLLEEYQGKGYGREVFDQLLQQLEKTDSERIILLVHKEAKWAKGFYDKLGFDIIAETFEDAIKAEPCIEKLYIKNTLLMRYKLNSES